MVNFNKLENGQKVRCTVDGMVLSVRVWRGDRYLEGERDMWPVSEFTPNEWEVVEEKEALL